MNVHELEALARLGESEALEFKTTTGERKDAMQALCAFLNHHGGKVIFGIDPSRRVLGQSVSERTLEDVAEEIRLIEPPVFPRVFQIEVRPGLHTIVVDVSAGPNVPYAYKGQSFRRIGNTNRLMSRDECNRILVERVHGERRWETELADGWSVDDLDISEITRTVDEAVRRGRMEDPGTRVPTELLRGLALMRGSQVLRAATVLFGKRARLEADFAQCLLRVAKFRGTDKSEFVDNRQFHGHLFALLQKAEQFLREHLPIAGRILPGLFERQDDPVYPLEALREALVNAFCHRDYSIGGGSVGVAIYQDRLEISSTGLLHFEITANDLFEPHESQPWNPLIARILHRRGLIETWGRGTIKIAELAQRAGLPKPEIEQGANSVLVRFRHNVMIPRRQDPKGLSERQRGILQMLSASPGTRRHELVAKLRSEAQSIKSDLESLKRSGFVQCFGRGRAARWFLLANFSVSE